MHTLQPEEDSLEVEEELGRANFLEPPMGVILFKVIPCAPR